jgi:hypothetical protein
MTLPSVRAFFAGIIDYAGLFPPAGLPLDRAIGNYARYRAGSDAWMLGRFIIPAARLGELDAFAHLFSSGPPLPLSVLGRGGATREEFLTGLRADAQAVTVFRSRYGDRVAIDVMELRLPPLEGGWDSLCEFGDTIDPILDPLFILPFGEFYEAAVGADWRESVETGASFADFQCYGRSGGYKFRCGGIDASAFPSPEQVAHVISYCAQHQIPVKFTAGLHHPIRHYDRGVSAKMHGFLNVFGVGVLAHSAGLGEQQVREIIEDEDPSHFGFDEIGFGWKQYHALTDEIIAARREFVVSFGSCSFDEPRADLRAMGILS